MTGLRLFRLVPVAEPDDPRWDVATNHGTVLVRAESPADARAVAAWAEREFRATAGRQDNGSIREPASAFCNERLYCADEDVTGQFPTEGPKGIVSGQLVKEP